VTDSVLCPFCPPSKGHPDESTKKYAFVYSTCLVLLNFVWFEWFVGSSIISTDLLPHSSVSISLCTQDTVNVWVMGGGRRGIRLSHTLSVLFLHFIPAFVVVVVAVVESGGPVRLTTVVCV